MARKLLSHYDTYRNYDEDEFDLEDEDDDEDDNGVNSFEAHYSFDGQVLKYEDQEEDDEEVMLGF